MGRRERRRLPRPHRGVMKLASLALLLSVGLAQASTTRFCPCSDGRLLCECSLEEHVYRYGVHDGKEYPRERPFKEVRWEHAWYSSGVELGPSPAICRSGLAEPNPTPQ